MVRRRRPQIGAEPGGGDRGAPRQRRRQALAARAASAGPSPPACRRRPAPPAPSPLRSLPLRRLPMWRPLRLAVCIDLSGRVDPSPAGHGDSS